MKHLPLDLSRFHGLTDNTPKRHDAQTLQDLRDYLSDSVETDRKESVELWSPNRYRSGAKRGNAGVEVVSCYVIDADGVSLDEAKPFLAPFEYLAHTTHSHSPEKPSWRFVLPLREAVPASEWEATWQRANAGTGNLNDESCKDASRFYYRASHKPGTTPQFHHHHGILLDVALLSNPDEFTLHLDKRDKEWKLNGVRRVLEKWDAEKRGDRHKTARDCVMALERLRDNGADTNEAFSRIHREFVASILNRCSPQEADAEWQRLVTGAERKVGTTPQRRTSLDPLPSTATVSTTPTDDDDEKRRESVADRLVRLGLSLYDFTLADDGEPLAIPRDGSPIAKPIRGDHTFQSELSARYFDDTGRVANTNALKEAITAFGGFAQRNERRTVHYRRADLRNRIILDLGERAGTVAELSANGFQILDLSPVTFRRAETLGQLPRPTQPNLDRLRELIPADETSFRMLLGWLVASHFDIPQPILLLDAPQGAGKTSTAKLLKRLTDPSPAEVNNPPRDEKYWRTVATNSHVVVLDNLSTIPRWLSDALCRAVTGDAAIERTLYSDNTPKVYAFRRAVILTSIHLPSVKGDLTERFLSVALQRIPDNERRSQRELDEHFETHVGEILAGLWRLVAGVIAQRRKLENAPRMADFGEILFALDDVTGWDTFATYTQNVRDLLASGANDDEVGRWLLEFAPATGTATYFTHELFQELQRAHRERNVSPTFPKDSGELGTRLSNLQENLRRAGLLVERATRSARGNRWTLSRMSAGSAGCAGSPLFPSVVEMREPKEAERQSA